MAELNIGPYTLTNRLALAPMAGVTDLPFRKLCRSLGAGYTVGEMLSCDPRLRGTRKSMLRARHDHEPEPVSVQIAGSDPQWMAEAAGYNVAQGAQIIDINMGCPVKKVCNKLAGSALLEDEALVGEILRAVVKAVDVPVTLKIRTGPEPGRRNGVTIARLAEQCGIAALAVHGRTRADRFKGRAEHETTRQICDLASIPVFVNGDIIEVREAAEILSLTGADGLMIGRGAQGNPWIFGAVAHFLLTGQELPEPDAGEVHRVLRAHLQSLHEFYGPAQGLRVARKHIGWYLEGRPRGREFRNRLMRESTASGQLGLVDFYFESPDSIAA